MTTVQMKSHLMQRIAVIDDKSFLSAIMTIVDTKTEAKIYYTTPEQKLKIKEAQNDFETGQVYSNEEVEKEMDQWLNEE